MSYRVGKRQRVPEMVGMGVGVLNVVITEGPTEKVIFEQNTKKDEKMSCGY